MLKKTKNKQNYLINLLHYLNEFKIVSLKSKDELKDILDYCNLKFNKDSVTDNTCICKLKSLFDKFDYISKYLDITYDFFEDINKNKTEFKNGIQ